MSGSLNMSLEKQGIVTILGSDCCERTTKLAKVTSLRRTLSADMSSKKWLAQHGFSSMKKTASSEELSLAFVDDHDSKEEEYDYEQKMNKDEDEKQGQFDIWSSIISQNKANNIPEPPPYVHPLVKRSSSSLSEKSLKICTESLGSETGSDVFSSYQASETGDVESDKEEEEHDQKAQQEQHQEKVSQPLFDGIEDQYGTNKSVKYNYSARKLPPRSFPPPLPILSQSDGASLHMRMHRDNGRLVLKAESIPLQKNFSALRQSGRLVLTFVNNNIDHSELKHEEIVEGKTTTDDQEFEEEFGNFEEEEGEKERDRDDDDDDEHDDHEEEEVFKEVSKENNGSREIDIVVMKQAQNMNTTRVNSVHRLALMMNKPIGLANRLNKYNEVVKFERLKEELLVESAPLPKSLPPRPPVARSTSSTPAVAKAAATAASFNAYEYFWRAKPSHYKEEKSDKLGVSNDEMVVKNNQQQQQMVVLRGNKAEYVVPLIKGCKEPRRSLLFWEPYCVATS